MVLRILCAAIFAASLVLAQDPGQGETGVDNSTAQTSTDGEVTIHYVTVGKSHNQFQPNSIQAEAGDIVSFQFYPNNHSVIRAAYGYPCVPYEDVVDGGTGFYSQQQQVPTETSSPPTWNLTINDTAQPIFYYCGAPGSCNGWGMVGVINANSSTELVNQIELAKQSDYMLLPGEPFPSEEQASIAALAATATTATLTVTATNSQEPGFTVPSTSNNGASSSQAHNSGLSPGAIAGIAIGAAVVALAVALLFFLLGRTKSLKNALDRSQATATSRRDEAAMSSMPFMATASQNQSRHTSSQLPPYQTFDAYGRDPQKMRDQDGLQYDPSGGQQQVVPPQRTMSPPTPYSTYGQQFVTSMQSLDPSQRMRFSPDPGSMYPPSQPPPPPLPPVELDVARSPDGSTPYRRSR